MSFKMVRQRFAAWEWPVDESTKTLTNAIAKWAAMGSYLSYTSSSSNITLEGNNCSRILELCETEKAPKF